MCLAAAVLTVCAHSAMAQAPEFKPADPKVAAEAIAAYEKISAAFAAGDFVTVVKGLADNGRPMMPAAEQTDDKVTKLADKLKAAKDAERTRTVIADAAKAKAGPADATSADVTLKNLNLTHVRIPLKGTKDVAEKHKLAPGRSTTDADGNLIVLMVRHEGRWYWNPFGW